MSQQIAKTILSQIGGNRFIAMTGAKNLGSTGSSLFFQLPSKFALKGINSVQITLTPMDLYDITFRKVWGMKVSEVSVKCGVFAEDLQAVFSGETGLCTQL